MRAVVALVAGIAAFTSAVEAAADDLETAAARQSDTAEERNSQPGVDPWLASSSALFTRPTLLESIKLSNDTNEDGESVYALATGVAAFGVDNKWIEGLQINASYNAAARVVSGGLKYNLDLKDVRFMSAEDVDAFGKQIEAGIDFEKCIEDELAKAGGDIEAAMKVCAAKEDEVIDKLLEERNTDWKPAVALAVGGGYDVENEVAQKFTVELSGEVKAKKLAITANLDLRRDPADAMAMTEKTWNVGGGPQLSYAFWKVEVSAGGKFLACLSGCGDESSTLEFGGQAAYKVSDDYSFGASIKWAGKGSTIGEAIGSLAMSYTFGKPNKDDDDDDAAAAAPTTPPPSQEP